MPDSYLSAETLPEACASRRRFRDRGEGSASAWPSPPAGWPATCAAWYPPKNGKARVVPLPAAAGDEPAPGLPVALVHPYGQGRYC